MIFIVKKNEADYIVTQAISYKNEICITLYEKTSYKSHSGKKFLSISRWSLGNRTGREYTFQPGEWDGAVKILFPGISDERCRRIGAFFSQKFDGEEASAAAERDFIVSFYLKFFTEMKKYIISVYTGEVRVTDGEIANLFS